jgi:GlpG protein
MLYDYPKIYQMVGRFIELYGFEALEKPSDLSSEGKALLDQIQQTPYWQGLYHIWLGSKDKEHPATVPPLFEKIREGEVWRLFSPCLLHGDPLHLLFNMLWLIVLGKQLEQRLSRSRYLLFILITGILSNTAQYLMSGPNFIGFSGILCAMLAFIWVRQMDAPWEGYQIDRLTLVFMLVYILGMAGVQMLSFVFEKAYDIALTPNIANMAHLSGGFIGFLLGKLSYFRWRQS